MITLINVKCTTSKMLHLTFHCRPIYSFQANSSGRLHLAKNWKRGFWLFSAEIFFQRESLINPSHGSEFVWLGRTRIDGFYFTWMNLKHCPDLLEQKARTSESSEYVGGAELPDDAHHYWRIQNTSTKCNSRGKRQVFELYFIMLYSVDKLQSAN